MAKTDDVVVRLDDVEIRLTNVESNLADLSSALNNLKSAPASAPVGADDVDAFHRSAMVYILDKYFGAELATIRALHADAVANPDTAANAAAAQVDPSTGAEEVKAA